MDRLETRELAYFVTVAEELHFGRAAERLGMAQPPLSRAISRLERRVGATLLQRTSRRVTLTAAGRAFLAASRDALAAVDAAVVAARQATASQPLGVAVRPGQGPALLAAVLSRFGAGAAAVPVEIMFTREQAQLVRDGTAEVALLCSTDDLRGLHTADLGRQAPVALLPAGHALASRSSVTMDALQAVEGFDEQCPQQPLEEILGLVALGRLVVIVGDTVAAGPNAGVAAVPVVGTPSSRLMLGWAAATPRPALHALIAAAMHVATGQHTGGRAAA